MAEESNFDYSAIEKRLGVSRRTFLKFCTGVAASLGLGTKAALLALERRQSDAQAFLPFAEPA